MTGIQAIGIHIYNCLFDTCQAIKRFFRNWCIFICPARHYENPVSVDTPSIDMEQRNIRHQSVDSRLQHLVIPSDDHSYKLFYNARARINAGTELIYDGSISLITQSLILPANERRFFMIRKPNAKGFPNLQGIGDIWHFQYETRVFFFQPMQEKIWLQIIDKSMFGYLVVAQRMQDIQWFPERANLAFRAENTLPESLTTRYLQRFVDHRRCIQSTIELQELPNALEIHTNNNPTESGKILSLSRRIDGATIITHNFHRRQK